MPLRYAVRRCVLAMLMRAILHDAQLFAAQRRHAYAYATPLDAAAR